MTTLTRSVDTRFPTAQPPLDLHAAVAALWPRLEGWLADERRVELLRVSADLPVIWRWGVLELRLARGGSRVDLMGCVCAVESDRACVGEHVAHPALRPARHVLEAWARSPAWMPVPLVWLEWDLPDGGERTTLPFTCVDPSLLFRHVQALTSAEQLGLVEAALALSTHDAREHTIDAVHRAVAALSPRARLLHVAPLAPRGRVGCRLVASLPIAELPGLLRDLHWSGDRRAVEQWAEQIGAAQQCVLVHYDAGSTEPYLAVETPLATRAPPRSPFTDALQNAGLAEPQRLETAARWPGQAHEAYADGSALIARSAYLKLAFFAGGGLEAKAYLGFNLAASADHPRA